MRFARTGQPSRPRPHVPVIVVPFASHSSGSFSAKATIRANSLNSSIHIIPSVKRTRRASSTASRAEILKLQQELGTTTIYVTHDQVEAMTMGDRIAVMSLGVLQQVGPPEELYREPRNLFVAGFIGSPAMNLVPVEVLDGAGGQGRVAGFRPEHVELASGGGNGIGFDARVEVVEYLGDEQLVHLTRKDTAIQAKLPVEEQIGSGQELKLAVPRDKLLL